MQSHVLILGKGPMRYYLDMLWDCGPLVNLHVCKDERGKLFKNQWLKFTLIKMLGVFMIIIGKAN